MTSVTAVPVTPALIVAAAAINSWTIYKFRK